PKEDEHGPHATRLRRAARADPGRADGREGPNGGEDSQGVRERHPHEGPPGGRPEARAEVSTPAGAARDEPRQPDPRVPALLLRAEPFLLQQGGGGPAREVA